jgi:hypothetical protein
MARSERGCSRGSEVDQCWCFLSLRGQCLPLMLRAIRLSLEAVGPKLEQSARTLTPNGSTVLLRRAPKAGVDQQLQPLASQRGFRAEEAGGIAARPSQALCLRRRGRWTLGRLWGLSGSLAAILSLALTRHRRANPASSRPAPSRVTAAARCHYRPNDTLFHPTGRAA